MTNIVPLGPVKFLTIHCAATPEGRNVTAETVSAWDKERFGQVSYHHVVELNGNVVDTLPVTEKGAHVGGHNTGNIGVCYIGGMDANNAKPKDTRTSEQKISLRKLVAHYKSIYPNLIVRGHRDWDGVKKACPSFDVRTEL